MWKAQIDLRAMLRWQILRAMARGMMPRRPAKTGRHEPARAKLRHENPAKAKATRKEVPRPAQVSKQRVANNSKGTRGKAADYNPVAPTRVSEILKRLDQLYPDVTCALTHRDPWELLVATILSAQSTDVRVNMVTPELFKKYPTVQDVAKLDPQQLEPDVRSTDRKSVV